MNTAVRVRAIILTKNNNLLVVKSQKPNTEVYWVFPGGGVEDIDNKNLKIALARELKEELNAEIDEISFPVYSIKRNVQDECNEYEIYYLVHIKSWNEENRTGPEFSELNIRGQYNIEEIPLDVDVLKNLALKPLEVKEFIIQKLITKEDFVKIELDKDIDDVFES
jgi:ADP-ribose pyrophosphatase YjhB (NUDIX family)